MPSAQHGSDIVRDGRERHAESPSRLRQGHANYFSGQDPVLDAALAA
jgi:hypothetical protein